MSIKHYNALRFRERSMEQLHRRMLKLMPEMRAYARELCREAILQRAVFSYDTAVLEGTPLKDVMCETIRAFSEEASKSNRGDDGRVVDLTLKVTVAPYKGRMYGIYHGGRQVSERFIEAIRAQDYHYQDQTDRPDEVSARAWNAREEVWSGIFKDSPCWVPADIGPAYPIIPETPTWGYGDREEFRAQFKPVGPERFRGRAFNRVLDRAMKGELVASSGIAPSGKDVPLSNVGTFYMEALRWMKTPAGQSFVDAEVAELKKKLPKRVTFAQLWPKQKE